MEEMKKGGKAKDWERNRERERERGKGSGREEADSMTNFWAFLHGNSK